MEGFVLRARQGFAPLWSLHGTVVALKRARSDYDFIRQIHDHSGVVVEHSITSAESVLKPDRRLEWLVRRAVYASEGPTLHDPFSILPQQRMTGAIRAWHGYDGQYVPLGCNFDPQHNSSLSANGPSKCWVSERRFEVLQVNSWLNSLLRKCIGHNDYAQKSEEKRSPPQKAAATQSKQFHKCCGQKFRWLPR
jgi:hypothetical protein